ncbi:MAG: 1-deoxy-D-xylulose-5-phosphate synthase N-terminal domain-containing protein [Alphaproteobacteria bacterium]
MTDTRAPRANTVAGLAPDDFACLKALEKKSFWLSSWTIHHANHLRPNRDGLKVGGHQASSASLVTLLTALYFNELRPTDRVAVKPHASPVYHAIQYLMGRQSVENLQNFRALGGAQSYPSRTKDVDQVDFSTGSVGLGVAVTLFASMIQDYLFTRKMMPEDQEPGRMVALMGDAELDEGNVWEAMLEGWKHDVRNLWWIIDYNRQSLDSTVSDRLFGRFDDIFRTTNWNVITLKYGKKLEAAYAKPGGDALEKWIDECPNSLYSALTYKGGEGFREHLKRDIGNVAGIKALLDEHDDAALGDLMTDLAGHDMESVLEAFTKADPERPNCFIAYTVKGKGMPFAGHKDNHAGLMTPDQMAQFRDHLGVASGEEWAPFAGLDIAPDKLQSFIERAPFLDLANRNHRAPRVEVPIDFPKQSGGKASTQEAFGKILNELGRGDSELADRIVTASPDVSVSTNLGAWINQRGIFDRLERSDVFKDEKVLSPLKWSMGQNGQHIELGIAENNLFLFLAAAGLSGPIFGKRLLPVGTLYDPFIMRGLDALNYACYQDSRFMLVATPSGITLAPEGGAHQSIATPLIGMAQDKLASFDPAFTDELAVIMRWGFEHMQADDGGSVYLRLSTRALEQPSRDIDGIADDIVRGAYWQVAPDAGAPLAIVYSGAVAPEAMAAHAEIVEDIPGAGLLAVTSPDLLHLDWSTARTGQTHAGSLLSRLAPDAALITVLDGAPATLSWLGSVRGQQVHPLGVNRFGQSGDIPDLYRTYGLDAAAIVDACATACLARMGA